MEISQHLPSCISCAKYIVMCLSISGLLGYAQNIPIFSLAARRSELKHDKHRTSYCRHFNVPCPTMTLCMYIIVALFAFLAFLSSPPQQKSLSWLCAFTLFSILLFSRASSHHLPLNTHLGNWLPPFQSIRFTS